MLLKHFFHVWIHFSPTSHFFSEIFQVVYYFKKKKKKKVRIMKKYDKGDVSIPQRQIHDNKQP